MRIWLQKHVVEGRSPLLDGWYRDHIAEVADPGTEVAIRTLPRRAYDVDLPYDYVIYGSVAIRFAQYFADSAVQAENEGYDAWVIAAGQDPGLAEARTLTTIPTLGYGNVAFHHCTARGIRFGLIGFVPGLREPIVDNVHRYRADHLLAGYEILAGRAESVAAAIAGEPGRFAGEFAAAAERAAAAGAQAIIPAEGLPAEIAWRFGIREAAGLPVLDPLGLLIKHAETEVRLRRLGCVARPRTGYRYARPDAAIEDHIDSVFAINRIEQEDR